MPQEEAKKAQSFVEQLQTSETGTALIKRILGMVARNEYKRRQAPPIIRVRARAFGSGRQMPIAARYDFEENRKHVRVHRQQIKTQV